MSQINVSGLTFGYEGSFDNIFDLLAVEHDVRFRERTATIVLSLDEGEMQRKGSKDGEDSYTLGIRV